MTLADWEREINTRPDDFTLRLVFADWLQDHDDEEMRGLAAGIRAFAECERFPNKFGWNWWFWWGYGLGDCPAAGIGNQPPELDPIYTQTAEHSSSAFAAFMFAAREWHKFDQAKFYEQFGPKEAVGQ